MNSVAFTKDGKFLATGGWDSMIRLFDVAQGTELGVARGHQSGTVSDLQFFPDDKVLVSTGADRSIRLWDVSDMSKPTLTSTLAGHQGLVFGVAISANGKWLASTGWDNQVKVWDLATHEVRWSRIANSVAPPGVPTQALPESALPAASESPAINGRMLPERFFDLADKDQNGEISEDEFKGNALVRVRFKNAGITPKFPIARNEFLKLYPQPDRK